MKQEFVPYDRALRLKALGFDSLKKEPCLAYYNESNSNHELETKDWWCLPQNDFQYALSAPTFSQAFRWFREKHDIVSYIQRFKDNTFDYECNSPKFKEVIDFEDGPFDTYEEAELACLDKLIEIVESK